MPENQDGVVAHNGIADDDGGTKQADKPEAQGQDGFVPLAGIYPLVNEPQGEDDLPEGAVNEQPQGHVLVPEELADWLCEIYEVDRETALQDVKKQLAQWKAYGLID